MDVQTSKWKVVFGIVLAAPFLLAMECGTGNGPPPLEIDETVITPSWPAPENGVYTRGAGVKLNLAIDKAVTGGAPDFSEFCFHNEDVLNNPICFVLDYSNGNTQMLTGNGVVAAVAPFGKHLLSVVKNTSEGTVEKNLDGIEITITDTAPPSTKKISAAPGLWSQTGPITVTLDTGEVKTVPRTYVVESQGMNVPTSIVVDPDTSSVYFVVTPKSDPMSNVGFGFVFVRVVGDGQTFVLEDMRIPQKPDPTRGLHVGTSTSFTKGLGLRAELTYQVQDEVSLFDASTRVRVTGFFNYGGTNYNLNEFIGTNGEDTIVIETGTEKLLLTHAFGEAGKVTLSFNAVDSNNVNIDAGSFEIIDLD